MKTAIVTGGIKGIGLAITKRLLVEGYHVIATFAHDDDSANNCKISLMQYKHSFDIIKCDQSKPKDIIDFCSLIKDKITNLDCLVCNAGTTIRRDLTDLTEEDWNNVMQVNVSSNVFLVKYLEPLLSSRIEKQEHKSIVFIGSLMGIHPHATSLAYGVTKSAVHALAKNLVKNFEGKNVTVNAIAPGFVETEWQKEKPQEIRNNICKKTAMNRFATTEEIADSVLFCIRNPFVNGSIIEVSGGYSYK